MIYPKDPPAADTLEVSVFGKGIGECIVVHAGDGEWLIADSLVNPMSGQPAALEYLTALGLDASNVVKLVVITHWHQDHTAGLAEIFRATATAQVVFSNAFRSSEFRELLGYDAILPPETSSLAEMRQIVHILRKRSPSHTATPLWAVANRLLRNTPNGDIYSLSPSDSSIMVTLEGIRSLIPSIGGPKRRFVAQGPNDTCVVLSIRRGIHAIILGADLESGNDPTRGWKAIATSTTCPHPLASAFKVAHHGSKNADEPTAWTRLIGTNVAAVLTPFRALRKPLPTTTDIERLLGRTQHLFCAGSRAGIKPPSRPSNVHKLVAGKLHVIDGRLGQVRIRFPATGGPSIEKFGAAEQLRAA
jgi:hypothetical protein